MIVICEREEYTSGITEFIQKMFSKEQKRFMLFHKELPFSNSKFTKRFYEKFNKVKPDEVYLFLREDFGGEDHLLKAKLDFEKNYNSKTPFRTFIIKQGEDEENSIVQEIPFELA